MNTLENTIKSIISEQLGIKKKKVLNNSSLTKDLGADSLDTIELTMALEDEFDIEIPDEKTEKMNTVQNIIDLVKFYKK